MEPDSPTIPLSSAAKHDDGEGDKLPLVNGGSNGRVVRGLGLGLGELGENGVRAEALSGASVTRKRSQPFAPSSSVEGSPPSPHYETPPTESVAAFPSAAAVVVGINGSSSVAGGTGKGTAGSPIVDPPPRSSSQDALAKAASGAEQLELSSSDDGENGEDEGAAKAQEGLFEPSKKALALLGLEGNGNGGSASSDSGGGGGSPTQSKKALQMLGLVAPPSSSSSPAQAQGGTPTPTPPLEPQGSPTQSKKALALLGLESPTTSRNTPLASAPASGGEGDVFSSSSSSLGYSPSSSPLASTSTSTSTPRQAASASFSTSSSSSQPQPQISPTILSGPGRAGRRPHTSPTSVSPKLAKLAGELTPTKKQGRMSGWFGVGSSASSSSSSSVGVAGEKEREMKREGSRSSLKGSFVTEEGEEEEEDYQHQGGGLGSPSRASSFRHTGAYTSPSANASRTSFPAPLSPTSLRSEVSLGSSSVHSSSSSPPMGRRTVPSSRSASMLTARSRGMSFGREEMGVPAWPALKKDVVGFQTDAEHLLKYSLGTSGLLRSKGKGWKTRFILLSAIPSPSAGHSETYSLHAFKQMPSLEPEVDRLTLGRESIVCVPAPEDGPTGSQAKTYTLKITGRGPSPPIAAAGTQAQAQMQEEAVWYLAMEDAQQMTRWLARLKDRVAELKKAWKESTVPLEVRSLTGASSAGRRDPGAIMGGSYGGQHTSTPDSSAPGTREPSPTRKSSISSASGAGGGGAGGKVMSFVSGTIALRRASEEKLWQGGQREQGQRRGSGASRRGSEDGVSLRRGSTDHLHGSSGGAGPALPVSPTRPTSSSSSSAGVALSRSSTLHSVPDVDVDADEVPREEEEEGNSDTDPDAFLSSHPFAAAAAGFKEKEKEKERPATAPASLTHPASGSLRAGAGAGAGGKRESGGSSIGGGDWQGPGNRSSAAAAAARLSPAQADQQQPIYLVHGLSSPSKRVSMASTTSSDKSGGSSSQQSHGQNQRRMSRLPPPAAPPPAMPLPPTPGSAASSTGSYNFPVPGSAGGGSGSPGSPQLRRSASNSSRLPPPASAPPSIPLPAPPPNFPLPPTPQSFNGGGPRSPPPSMPLPPVPSPGGAPGARPSGYPNFVGGVLPNGLKPLRLRPSEENLLRSMTTTTTSTRGPASAGGPVGRWEGEEGDGSLPWGDGALGGGIRPVGLGREQQLELDRLARSTGAATASGTEEK